MSGRNQVRCASRVLFRLSLACRRYGGTARFHSLPFAHLVLTVLQTFIEIESLARSFWCGRIIPLIFNHLCVRPQARLVPPTEPPGFVLQSAQPSYSPEYPVERRHRNASSRPNSA